jgi:hypothetical protein
MKQTSISLINTYHDGTTYNPGDRIPTLIKISGKLALSEYINLGYPDRMKLYLPNNKVSVDKFVTGLGELGCSFFCKVNKSMSAGIS